MARPSKRTPERREAILRSLRIGNTREASAKAAGMSADTLARWMAGSAAFRGEVHTAEAEAEQRFLGFVAQAASTDWRAAAFWLERRRYQDYARRDRMTMLFDLRREAAEVAAAAGIEDVDAMVELAEQIATGRR